MSCAAGLKVGRCCGTLRHELNRHIAVNRLFETFRAAVMADPPLQSELMMELETDAFAALAIRHAAEREIVLDEAALCPPADPAGIARFLPRPPDGTACPSACWRPVSMSAAPAGPLVDWHCFSGIATDTPFFEEAIRRAGGRPFNRIFAWRMALGDMMRAPPEAAEPAGFIFHLSRCGSTLVHRMLAASGLAVCVSEAAVFDQALQLCHDSTLTDSVRCQVLRTMAACLANDGSGRPLVLKLDAWHILHWRLLHAAFPATPMVFLHRDPVEILVSQRRQPGMQAVPHAAMAVACGIADHDSLGLDEYGARLLAAFCREAAVAVAAGAMIAIDYRDLPDAVLTAVLPRFGLAADASAQVRLHAEADRDAKYPHQIYARDAAAKQAEADDALRELVARVVGEAYRALGGARGPAA